MNTASTPSRNATLLKPSEQQASSIIKGFKGKNRAIAISPATNKEGLDIFFPAELLPIFQERDTRRQAA
jgi:hypothetical protein